MNDKYLKILIQPLQTCLQYQPKFGLGEKNGLTLPEFRQLYGSDPFYAWFGLDHPLLYAAHRAAGGITSIYRQIGIGVERLFREILKDTLSLSDTDVQWSYAIDVLGGKQRILSLDARIPLESIKDETVTSRRTNWMVAITDDVRIEQSIRPMVQGIVFEVRQGYKSKDSKRQNADITNAATAYTKGYLPCLVVLSSQIDEDIRLRYQNEKWSLLTGHFNNNPRQSIYAFMKDVIGYDLADFFKQNSEIIRQEVVKVLEHLLTTEHGDTRA